ncbi:hypothetical protein Tco_0933272 [Tanacetum coccineum]
MALPPCDQGHQYLRNEGLQYTDADIADFEMRLARIYRREHKDAQGVSLFTSRVWRRLFDIKGLLSGRARRRLSWRQFMLALGLHTDEEMQTVRYGAYWAESARQIPDKGDLRDY